VALAYSPEWEAHIFGTTPAGIWRDVSQLNTPALVVRGAQSNTFRPAAQARMAHKLPQACFATIPRAGHLLPMERPDEVGAVIRDFLERTF
jgi:pimeloyl-ACP methyl ester carboxylesterase